MSRVVELNPKNWKKEVLQSSKLVLVDFWHEKCQWCKRLNPIINEASEHHKNVKFTKLNVLVANENRKLAIKNGVMGTPTLMFFCKGRVIETTVGFQPKNKFNQLIKDMKKKGKTMFKSKHKTGEKPRPKKINL
jgi:thioredoxin 1